MTRCFSSVLSIFSFLLIVSCDSAKPSVLSKECPRFLKNDFNKVVLVEQTSSINNKIVKFNEARYTCVADVNSLSKAMSNTFGEWDTKISRKGASQNLVWEKVQLFKNDTTHYQVVTSGVKLKTKVFTSVAIFNQDARDLLSDTSPLKEKLISYFGNLIKNND